MPNEYDPIIDDESVYRRILRQYYDSELGVDRLGFSPSSKDHDGLSFFRSQFVGAEDVARDKHGNLGRYYVALLNVAEIRKMALSLNPAPVDTLPGHCLMPEIYKGMDRKSKEQAIEKQLELARLASSAIVYVPE